VCLCVCVFVYLATASTCNVVLMRYNELYEGIEVVNEDQQVVGTSRAAGVKVCPSHCYLICEKSGIFIFQKLNIASYICALTLLHFMIFLYNHVSDVNLPPLMAVM